MARTKWTVKGTLQFAPQLSEVALSYGDPVPLAGVRVLVEAKEFAWDPTWDNWGDDVTNASGGFRITNDKDRTPRMFRVRAMFKDDDLKIYPPNTGLVSQAIERATDGNVIGDLTEDALEQAISHVTRLAYDVDWFTIHQDDKDHKHSPDTVDLGTPTFKSGGGHDLGDRTARRHAEIWFTCRLVMGLLQDAGSGLGFPRGKPVAIMHPHENPLIPDRVEQSFSSPYNQVAYLVETSQVDGFDVPTIIHELLHLWVYQRTHGEDALAWQLFIHGSTHNGLQKKTWVAAHEGIAEWATHQLHRVLFGAWPMIYGGPPESRALPFTRSFLKSKGVTVLQDVDRSEWGWMSLLNILRNGDIATLDVTGSDDYAPSNSRTTGASALGTPIDPPDVGGEEPSFLDVMAVLNEHPSQGVLGRSGMNMGDFVDRALAIMPQHSASERASIVELLNPRPAVAAGPPRKQQEPPRKHQEPRPQARTAGRPATGRTGAGRPAAGRTAEDRPARQPGRKVRER